MEEETELETKEVELPTDPTLCILAQQFKEGANRNKFIELCKRGFLN